MSNCEGAICANSSFSWLGAFFQDKTKGKRFMPSQWIRNKNCAGIYPTWATVVDISSTKETVELLENSQNNCNYIFTESGLVDWRKMVKKEYLYINPQNKEKIDF
jgi:hypothetical protein